MFNLQIINLPLNFPGATTTTTSSPTIRMLWDAWIFSFLGAMLLIVASAIFPYSCSNGFAPSSEVASSWAKGEDSFSLSHANLDPDFIGLLTFFSSALFPPLPTHTSSKDNVGLRHVQQGSIVTYGHFRHDCEHKKARRVLQKTHKRQKVPTTPLDP